MKNITISVLFCLFSFLATAQLLPGMVVPDIILPDTNDSVVTLSSFRGKVVLIDFWASWCGPCRAANPGVVKLYKKYKDQGFEVFGVSVDKKKAEWVKAIKKDKITYQQVNDNGGWESKTLANYFVNEIPTSFLIDKAGRLVAVDLTGKGLKKLVAQLLESN